MKHLLAEEALNKFISLCEKDYKILDIGLKPENLELVGIRDLRELAKKKNIKCTTTTGKDDIIRDIREAFK